MINFQSFLNKLNHWRKATNLSDSICWQLLFSYSKKVKNLLDYTDKKDQLIDFKEIDYYQSIIKHWIKEIPLARLTGIAEFANQDWFIFPDVFIPRHETELLLTSLAKHLDTVTAAKYNYLDLCTGSGALAATMQQEFNFQSITVNDIDQSAINNCLVNFKNKGLNCLTLCVDWTKISEQFTAEIITANFPYLSFQDEVNYTLLLNEPLKALYSIKHACYHYNKFFEFLKQNIYWKIVALEISGYFKTELIIWQKLFKIQGWKNKIYYDLQTLPRCLIIIK